MQFRATNNAGLTTTGSATTVKIDTSVPTLTLSASGAMGANNWYTSDATITASASDARFWNSHRFNIVWMEAPGRLGMLRPFHRTVTIPSNFLQPTTLATQPLLRNRSRSTKLFQPLHLRQRERLDKTAGINPAFLWQLLLPTRFLESLRCNIARIAAIRF